MGIDNGIGSETTGTFAGLDATLILRNLTRGRIFWRENGKGWRPRRCEFFLILLLAFIHKVSALVKPELFSPLIPSSNPSLLPSSVACSTNLAPLSFLAVS